LVGTPVAASILLLFHFGPLAQTSARRYVNHPAEMAEVVLFCCALAAFASKLWRARAERKACRGQLLPAWDGQPMPPSEAAGLLAGLNKWSSALGDTYLVQRLRAVLHFLGSRGSAAGLDDQMRTLADNDALTLEGSYALTRFITWAIPILGFLGTVLGITQAISGVTPEMLETNLSYVTDGLALAFDTTALGLGLTMITMFVSFLVERVEQGVLDQVDHYVDSQLAHRFEQAAGADGDFVAALRQNTQVLLQATEQLVQRQAAVWGQTLQELERRRAGVEDRLFRQLTAAVEGALDRTQETHARRLQALEQQALEQTAGFAQHLAGLGQAITEAGRQQQAGLSQIAQGMTAQAQTLAGLQADEQHLLRLQHTFEQNLAALAGAGAFDQAVHTLTAAIHLLTARAEGLPAGAVAGRLGMRPGAAA
jgi:biopolymer transport protein ExbB/TolQ